METKMRLSLVILTLGLLLPHCVRTDDDPAASATTAATTTTAPTTPATTTPVPKVEATTTTAAATTTTVNAAVPSSTIAAAATTTKMLPPPPPDVKTTAATSSAAAPSATQNVTPTPSKSPDVSTTKPSGGGGQVLSVPSPNDGQTSPAVPNDSSAVSTTVAKPDDNQSNIAHQGGDSSTSSSSSPNSSQQPATTKAPADQVSAIPTAAVSAQPSGSGSVTSSTATDAGRGPGTGTTPSTQAGGSTTTVYRPPQPSLAPEDNTTTTVPPPTTTALPTTTTMATTAPLESHTHEYIKKEQPEEGEAMLDKICSRLLQLFVDGAKCSMAYRRRGSDKPMFDTVEISGKVNTSIVKSHYDDLQKVPTNDPKESDDQSAHTTLVAILASCGALALIIVGLAICTYRHGKNYRKNQCMQQHLTEEMPTVENGYHDNPTLEMEVPTETSPSPLEKKLPRPNGQTSEFNDSWIVPIDNLLKDDMIPDEEDTHL